MKGPNVLQIMFPFSHAFDRSKVYLTDADQLKPCLVEFADGVVVTASASEKEGDAILLDIPAYRTAAGNDIAPRSWRLVRSDDGIWRSERR